jgi:GH25 family lysozyme M1 (1,4-beta-N-acetylmuramidase)
MLGIDIYNRTRVNGLDLARVKAAGYSFTIVKATEGVSYTDPSFTANVDGARAAGLLVGAYHLLRATPIDQQAADFLAAISGHGPYCCLAIDVEDVGGPELSNLGKAAITDRILTIYRAARAAGYTCPVYVYASAAWLRSLIDVTVCRKAGLLIWIAAYSNDTPDSTDRSADCDMWQWCSDGKVPGVTGNTDCDVCYRGIDSSAPAKPAVPQNVGVNAWYRVRAGGVWLPEVRDLTDFAGRSNGTPITDVAVRVSAGTVKYRVHVLGGNWLPYVTGCNVNDGSNGYAGGGKPIDAVEVYYTTPDSIRPYKRAKYRVASGAGGYYPWQYDDQTTDGQDGYAGSFGREIGKLQLCIE